MTKFILLSKDTLFFIALVFTLIQLLIINLLKMKQEKVPENPKEE
jgi:hypothetical protein